MDQSGVETAFSHLGFPAVTWQNLGFGLAALALAIVIGWVLRMAVHRFLTWRGRGTSAAKVFGSLAAWVVGLFGFAAALTLVFPSVRPVDVLGGVGVITLAAGIAFQTVLGNAFAGIVILARDLYRVGDQVEVGGHAGTITHMGLSATTVQSFDGRKKLIPNSTMHSEVVTVQTGYETRRSAVPIEVDAGTDLDHAAAVAVAAMREVPGVMDEPEPQVLVASIATGAAELELRFWSGSRQFETRAAQSNVIRAVLKAFREAGIQMAATELTITTNTTTPAASATSASETAVRPASGTRETA